MYGRKLPKSHEEWRVLHSLNQMSIGLQRSIFQTPLRLYLKVAGILLKQRQRADISYTHTNFKYIIWSALENDQENRPNRIIRIHNRFIRRRWICWIVNNLFNKTKLWEMWIQLEVRCNVPSRILLGGQWRGFEHIHPRFFQGRLSWGSWLHLPYNLMPCKIQALNGVD